MRHAAKGGVETRWEGQQHLNLHFKLYITHTHTRTHTLYIYTYFALLFIAESATRRMLNFVDNWSENKHS